MTPGPRGAGIVGGCSLSARDRRLDAMHRAVFFCWRPERFDVNAAARVAPDQ